MKTKTKWVYLKEVDSTNDYAKQYVHDHNVAVLAEAQTHGKGRCGRAFLSGKSGMYLSVVRMDDLPLSACSVYMLAAPLAVCDVLAAYGIKGEIKWPNDVWVANKKIAGVLVETEWREERVYRAVVGIGLNVSNDIGDVPCAATSMRLEGVSATVKEVAERVVDALSVYFDMSPAALVATVKPRLLTLGRRVRLPDGRVGTAIDLADDGRLIVKIGGECIAVAAGDVNLAE